MASVKELAPAMSRQGHECQTNGIIAPTLTCGQDHKLLHGELVASMGTTIDYIKCRNRQNDIGVTSKVSNVPVKATIFNIN
jgi:hypothetical protein